MDNEKRSTLLGEESFDREDVILRAEQSEQEEEPKAKSKVSVVREKLYLFVEAHPFVAILLAILFLVFDVMFIWAMQPKKMPVEYQTDDARAPQVVYVEVIKTPDYIWSREGDAYYHVEENCGAMTDAKRYLVIVGEHRRQMPCPVCMDESTRAE